MASKNAATTTRRLEEGGFTQEQAMADGLGQKIDRFREGLEQKIDRVRDDLGRNIEQVRQDLREYIHVVVGEAAARLEKTSQQESNSTVKWVAGIIILQTVALLTSVNGLVKFLM